MSGDSSSGASQYFRDYEEENGISWDVSIIRPMYWSSRTNGEYPIRFR